VQLTDKIAVVTGAASGIGRATATTFAELGAIVWLTDVDTAGGEGAAAAIRDAGGRALFHPLDVTDLTEAEALVGTVRAEHGRLDVVANVAGRDVIGPFMDSDPMVWEQLVTLNLLGPVRVCRAAVELLADSGGGAIVNVASDAGRVGSSGETVYAGAKGGVIAFTKSLAREVVRLGIRVNCVCPGPTDTPLLATLPEGLRQSLEKSIPMRRVGRPAEIADAIAFFASDRSSYCTGQVLSVSGGLTMAD
jgi:2-hydroxycyclohexanecarboxyl-CoA dehydrogenase